MIHFDKKRKGPLVVVQSYAERESVQVKKAQKDLKEEKVSHQKTLITTRESSLQDRKGASEVTKEIIILSKKTTDLAPPPPPPMPNGMKNSWKPPQPSPGKNSPPSCPTPDYDTSSSSAPSPTASLIAVNVHSSPHRGNLSQNNNSPVYATVNKAAKSVLNSATNGTKTVSTSQHLPKNSDSVEMQSIESFTLNHAQKPKPPDTYFVPVRKKNANNPDSWREKRTTNKPRPVSVTIGEYPTGVERRLPTRFDFLPSHGATVVSTSENDGSNINGQLQSELTQTLMRSNLRKHTSPQELNQNGVSSAKGMVTISVNNQSPVEEPRSHANKIHIESNNSSRSKVSIVTSEYRNQVPSGIKPAIKSTADKLVKSMGTVTIKVPNGAESNH